MTYQEKAQELIEKYAPIMPNENWQDRAKQCAIIAVDEIINTGLLYGEAPFGDNGVRFHAFWQQVKNELTK